MKRKMDSYHIPVMAERSIKSLNIKPDGIYVDCTLGEAGHSKRILNLLGEKGKLYSMDHDIEAIEWVKNQYKELLSDGQWNLINDNFSNINKYFEVGSVDGILMDLGLSSRHLDIEGRGFSFKHDADPLDMRMDRSLGVTASDLINGLNVNELAELISKYGEERGSYRIAKALKESDRPIENVMDLNYQINRAVPAASADKSHYQRIYQALRIAVNDEINSLKIGLSRSIDILKPSGRIAVISFHSLEDRVVKKTFNEFANNEVLLLESRKPILPDSLEISKNPRSRSAKLRVGIKK